MDTLMPRSRFSRYRALRGVLMLSVLVAASSPTLAQSITGPLAGGLHINRVEASGLSINNLDVPIGGFQPWVGFGLTDEFDDGAVNETFFQAVNSSSPGGTALGAGGTPYYGVGLLDTGAQVNLLTSADNANFDLAGAGFLGSEQIAIGGATGFVFGDIEDPLGVYAAGLSNATSTGPLVMDTGALQGQTSVSMVTAPSTSGLPSVIGIPMASQYTTVIRNDQPQIITTGGQTYRSPDIDFLPLGQGASQGITRRAPMYLSPGDAFLVPPAYIFNISNVLMGLELYDNPQAPTNVPGGLFLTVNAADSGNEVNDKRFFFDTGAEVSVVSQLVAAQLGFDAVLDTPDFIVDISGSGGTVTQVPGFVADQFEIVTVGGDFTLQNVPLVVLDVVDTGDPGNIVPGIVGTNLFQGRNLVIDPSPSIGGGGVGPSLYISDVVLDSHDWATTAASGTWATAGNWNAAGTPGELWIANVVNTSGAPQQAVVDANTTVNQVVVSGGASTIEVVVNNGVTLTTFGNLDVQAGGGVDLQGGTVSAENVLLNDGSLTGEGTVLSDVANESGMVAPGTSAGLLNIDGSLAQRADATLAIEIGGLVAGDDYDQVAVEGVAVLDGNLSVSLIGFDPLVGHSFEILTATDGVNGTFSILDLPALATGRMWGIDYNTTSVTLDVMTAMLGDMNGDGLVNMDDAGPLIMALTDRAAYDAEFLTVDADMLGDVDGSGWFDLGDVSAFVELLSPGSSATVPEPTAVVLFLLGSILMFSGRRR